jgi:hypothetical protein
VSLEAVVWTLKNSPLQTKGILVHIAMANVVNDLYDNQVFMKLDTLVEVSRCSRATVCATIAQLLELGLLEKVDSDEESHRRRSQHKPVRYRFLMPQPEVQGLDVEGEARSRVWTSRGPDSDCREVQGLDVHIEEENNGESNSVHPSATDVGATVLELRSEDPPRPVAPSFDDFYDAYGKKLQRLAAEKAWKKVLKEGADPVQVVAAALAYRRSLPPERRQFQPYPASWLNAGGWMDELEETGEDRLVRRAREAGARRAASGGVR